jgi:hypothetical protein
MKCDRCGKFRKTTDVAMSDHGDQFGNYDYATECRWCMAPFDRERFNMPIPILATPEGDSQ